MTPLAAFGVGLATAALLLTLVWVVQLFTRNAGLVDVVWSAAVGLIAAEYALLGDAPAPARILLAALALTWALRLASYLAMRMRGAGEDSRYAAARQAWGAKADLYMLGFFLFQAMAASILSIPFLVIAYMPEAPSLGVALARARGMVRIGRGRRHGGFPAAPLQAEAREQGQSLCRRAMALFSSPQLFFRIPALGYVRGTGNRRALVVGDTGQPGAHGLAAATDFRHTDDRKPQGIGKTRRPRRIHPPDQRLHSLAAQGLSA
jgi:hypothetical protein